MAQTKRKRRTKHRGNAAGVVEARGRTGRPPTPQERKAARSTRGGARVLKEPTWRSATIKAGAMAILLFVMTQAGFLVQNASIISGLVVSLVALALYTPLAYMTDRWAYNRQQRRLTQGR